MTPTIKSSNCTFLKSDEKRSLFESKCLAPKSPAEPTTRKRAYSSERPEATELNMSLCLYIAPMFSRVAQRGEKIHRFLEDICAAPLSQQVMRPKYHHPCTHKTSCSVSIQRQHRLEIQRRIQSSQRSLYLDVAAHRRRLHKEMMPAPRRSPSLGRATHLVHWRKLLERRIRSDEGSLFSCPQLSDSPRERALIRPAH